MHLPFISGEAVWDDAAFIPGNPAFSDCSSAFSALAPEAFLSVERRPLAARPVTLATLAADHCRGGISGVKVTNALLHGMNSALLFFYLAAATGAQAAAFPAAALFALHPAAAEAVHIGVFRNHLLSFFFVFCALALLLHESVQGRWKREAAALGCFAAGLLSGETAAAFPFMLVAQWAASERPIIQRRRMALLGAAAAVLLLYFWFRLPRSGYDLPDAGLAVSGLLAPLYPREMFPAGERACYAIPAWLPPWHAVYSDAAAKLYTMSGIMLSYARDLLIPFSLKGDYSPAVINSARQGLPAVAALAAALAAPFALLASRRRRRSGAGLLMAAAALLPVSGLFDIYNLRADRYLYLPMGGTALFWAAAAAGAGAWARKSAAAIGALAVLFGVLTAHRLPDFASSRAFFERAAAAGGNPRAEINLSAIAAAEGEYEEAERRLMRAVGVYPGDPHALLRLAETRLYLRRPDEALKTIGEIRVEALVPAALYLRGTAMWQKGKPAGAAALYAEAEAAAGCFDQARAAGAAAALLSGKMKSVTLEGPAACAAPYLLRRLDLLGVRPSPAQLADRIEKKNLNGPCRNW